MSLGQGLGQGLMLVAQNVAQNRRANQAQKRQLEMFNLKRVADIEDFQKMEELKDNLTSKKRQRNLDLLTAKYGNNNAIPQTNAAIPSSEPISENGAVPLPIPMPSSPVQEQANPAQPQVAPAMFNDKAWQQQHFEDYYDDETGAFDKKGFRKGLEDAQKENATLQYLRANNLDVPEGVNLGTLSPFIGSMLGEKKETKKLEYKTQGNKIAQKILTDPGYRTGKKQLTDSELEALAKGGINIDSLYRSDGSLDVANATEAARIIATNMKPQQIAVSLRPPKVGRGGGGRGRSGGASGGGTSGGGASGYKQTRDGNFVKVDKRGNPAGQIISAKDAYNMGITNTAPQRRPRAVQGGGGGGTAELIRQQLNSIKGFD
jgi:hypothetical protein